MMTRGITISVEIEFKEKRHNRRFAYIAERWDHARQDGRLRLLRKWDGVRRRFFRQVRNVVPASVIVNWPEGVELNESELIASVEAAAVS